MVKTSLKSTIVAESNSKASKGILAIVEKCLLSAKTAMQAINQLEVQINDTALKCMEHAEAHGDVMPADRLVKGLMEMNHPATTRLAQEVVSWFRSNSPIRWDAKGAPKQLKEGEEGFKPYNVLDAEETPFFETTTAKRAREAANTAHNRALKPVTYQDVLNRLKGIRKFVTNATSSDKNGEVRGIAKGEKAKILKLLGTVEEAAGILGETDQPEETKKAA